MMQGLVTLPRFDGRPDGEDSPSRLKRIEPASNEMERLDRGNTSVEQQMAVLKIMCAVASNIYQAE
jgi:hypothetical protein